MLQDDYCRTLSGDVFLLHDSGADSGNARFLVFATQDNLDLLARHDSWYADGTFKTVPLLFYQLYSLCVRVDGCIIPVVYAILPNKTQAMYEQLLQVLLARTDMLQPSTLVTDFEQGASNAFRLKFPGIECTGCFFHLSQNVYRRVQLNGLQERYANDAQLALAIRMLPALAFVPIGDVVNYFEELEDNFPDEAEPILTDFEQTYIGTLRPHGQRRTLLFPIALRNVHDRTLMGEDRTNNAQEGWHRRFASIVTCHHPTIWKIIECLKMEQATTEREVERLVAGHAGPKRKKKYQQCDERLRALLHSIEQRSPREFLRVIWHSTLLNKRNGPNGGGTLLLIERTCIFFLHVID